MNPLEDGVDVPWIDAGWWPDAVRLLQEAKASSAAPISALGKDRCGPPPRPAANKGKKNEPYPWSQH